MFKYIRAVSVGYLIFQIKIFGKCNWLVNSKYIIIIYEQGIHIIYLFLLSIKYYNSYVSRFDMYKDYLLFI